MNSPAAVVHRLLDPVPERRRRASRRARRAARSSARPSSSTVTNASWRLTSAGEREARRRRRPSASSRSRSQRPQSSSPAPPASATGAPARAANTRDVGRRAAEVGREPLDLRQRRHRRLADQVDERLAQAQDGRRSSVRTLSSRRRGRRRAHDRGRRRARLLPPRAAGGRRPSLYLHSVPTSCRRLAGLPGAHRRRRAATCPASGAAARAASSTTRCPRYVDFLERLPRRARAAEQVGVVGHGWGAAIGLLFAQRHPDRVQRLALIDAVPLLDGFAWPPIVRWWRRPVLGELLMGSVNRWLLARALRRGSALARRRGPTRGSTPSGSSSTRAPSGRSCACTARSTRPGWPRAGADLEQLQRCPRWSSGARRDPWLGPGFADAYAPRLPERHASSACRAPGTGRGSTSRELIARAGRLRGGMATPATCDGHRPPRAGAAPDRRAGARRAGCGWRPTLVAALFAAAYVIISPPSLDLADHLFRAQLFRDEGFGLWNNLWYSGHHIVGYSVLFPAVSRRCSPPAGRGAGGDRHAPRCSSRWPAATSATDAWLGARPVRRRHRDRPVHRPAGLRLRGAAGARRGRRARPRPAAPALRRWRVLSALCSPVAALFAALIAAGYALGGLVARAPPGAAALPGAAVAVAALVPVGLLAIAFPEGGTEPFGFPTMLPVAGDRRAGAGHAPRGRRRRCARVRRLRAGDDRRVPGALADRLQHRAPGDVPGRAHWPRCCGRRRHPALLAAAILPLLYLGWAAPVRDVVSASDDQSATTGYYQPLLRFLRRAGGRRRRRRFAPRSRSRAFTGRRGWWRAHFPLARGWERQLDIADNPLFYRRPLTAAAYDALAARQRGPLRRRPRRPAGLLGAERDGADRPRAALPAPGRCARRTGASTRSRDATPIASGVATLTGSVPTG